MSEVTVVVPNYNGMQYIKSCLDALACQRDIEIDIVVVDNGSADGSADFIRREYPGVRLIRLPENTGFCHAVNVGIKACDTPFVILLNNDTEVEPDFAANLTRHIAARPDVFSVQAKMIAAHVPDTLDDGGDFYSALGWAFARGKGKPEKRYDKEGPIFSACAGAAIYRRSVFAEIGLFDELHFAYLEDTDIGYRAKIYGYKNLFLPSARVYHVGSGTSGSRYNEFKIRYSSRNNIYLIYKNMPALQLLINLPFLAAGFLIKLGFFALKGFGALYVSGLGSGFKLAREGRRQGRKVRFRLRHLPSYIKIEFELLVNIFRRFF